MSGLKSGDTILSHISLREEYIARLVELSQSKAWKNLRKEIKKIIGLLRLQTIEALEVYFVWEGSMNRGVRIIGDIAHSGATQ